MVMLQLRKEHAEIRLSAFQIANELFFRSHVFRELLISDFQKFSQLVAETDPKRPLPLPKPAARQLKEKSLLAIREWNEKFGDGYPKLKLGFSYLKHNKKVSRRLEHSCMINYGVDGFKYHPHLISSLNLHNIFIRMLIPIHMFMCLLKLTLQFSIQFIDSF